MALRPGSRLLISSHFIPLPRSSMINASSSGDHLDCFLAGDSAVWAGCKRLAGTEAGILVMDGGGTDGPETGDDAIDMGGSAGPEGTTLDGNAVVVVPGGLLSSSS